MIRQRTRIKRSTKSIPKVNVEATRKRRLRNQKRMRSPEYKAARTGARERAGGRCEFIVQVTATPVPVIVREGEGIHISNARMEVYDYERCPEMTRLQFHEEHYARGRILTASDGKMYCPHHHMMAEKHKMHNWHKTRMF